MEIAPFEFPILLSKYCYENREGVFGNGDFYCDDSPYVLVHNQERLSNKNAPGIKLHCEVFVYIHPKTCREWNTNTEVDLPYPLMGPQMSVRYPVNCDSKLSEYSHALTSIRKFSRIGWNWYVSRRVFANEYVKYKLQERTQYPYGTYQAIHSCASRRESTRVLGTYLALTPRNKFEVGSFEKVWLTSFYQPENVTENSFCQIIDYHYEFQEVTETDSMLSLESGLT